MGQKKIERYLIRIDGCVDPWTLGPYPSDSKRNEAAKKIHAEMREADALFGCDVRNNVPHVWAFSAGFFQEGL